MERLEFDGYCKELKLAWEYQGRQHYEYIQHFHKKCDSLQKQQERDSKKRELCKENGITLIEEGNQKQLIRKRYLIKYLISH